jgi:uncharacterized protein YecE (DUF72 family)
MQLFVGTSGYSYKPWKGKFYPEKMKEADMLRFYATRFGTVEINNTFYRMPAPAMLSRWDTETPEPFRFVLKAPQRITHHKRLAAVDDDVRYFLETSAVLGAKRGPLLFQLPPYLKRPLEQIVPTADWGYLRLRRAEYTADDLAAWRARVCGQPWQEAYVFFKHEDEGRGPAFAEQFQALG